MDLQPPVAPPPGQPARFDCPYCHTDLPPHTRRRISTAGWIVFAVLLVTCLPLFWIGLLIKEDEYFCSACGMKLA